MSDPKNEKPIDLRLVAPNAHAYELQPGKGYVLVLRGPVPAREVRQIQQAIRNMGVNGIVLAPADNMEIALFEMESNGKVEERPRCFHCNASIGRGENAWHTSQGHSYHDACADHCGIKPKPMPTPSTGTAKLISGKWIDAPVASTPMSTATVAPDGRIVCSGDPKPGDLVAVEQEAYDFLQQRVREDMKHRIGWPKDVNPLWDGLCQGCRDPDWRHGGDCVWKGLNSGWSRDVHGWTFMELAPAASLSFMGAKVTALAVVDLARRFHVEPAPRISVYQFDFEPFIVEVPQHMLIQYGDKRSNQHITNEIIKGMARGAKR